jgi:DNA-binding MarR family transcriptional regulator
MSGSRAAVYDGCAVEDTATIEKISQEIARLFNLVFRAGGRLGDPEDRRLTNTQSLALMTIVNEGPLRLWALAERMLTTDATATRTVDALVADGLATRHVEPLDKRGVLISATPEGKRIHAERDHRMYLVVSDLLTGTDEPHLLEIASFLTDLNERIGNDDEVRGARPAAAP